jgi:hypothetical protein
MTGRCQRFVGQARRKTHMEWYWLSITIGYVLTHWHLYAPLLRR